MVISYIGKEILVAAFMALFLTGTDCRAMSLQKTAAPVEMQAELVWIRPEGGESRVFYSFLGNDAWSRPLQLSDGKRHNLVPTLVNDGTGRTVIVWTVLAETGSTLSYAILRNGVIEAGPATITTGLATNTAPYLAADKDGVTWLVWSGNNGTTSDIFYSSWQDGNWLPPKRAHSHNQVPDILPELSVEPDGGLTVSWQTYGPDGVTRVTRRLTGSPAPDGAYRAHLAKEEDISDPFSCITSFPADDIDLEAATLLNHCLENTSTRQVRFPGKVRQR